MKTMLFSAFAGLAVAALAATGASANPSCDPTDVACVDTNEADAGSGNPLEPVTSQLPAQGVLAIGFTSAQGLSDYWAFFDGDGGSPDPLDGYIGFAGADLSHSLLGVVGNSSGDFQRAGGNTSISALIPGAPGFPSLPPAPSLPGVGVPGISGLPVGPSNVPTGLPDTSNVPQLAQDAVLQLPPAPGPPDVGMGSLVLPATIALPR